MCITLILYLFSDIYDHILPFTLYFAAALPEENNSEEPINKDNILVDIH